jgi:hypothetical protein
LALVSAAVAGAGAMSAVTATGASLFVEASSFEEGGTQLSLTMTAMFSLSSVLFSTIKFHIFSLK